MLSSVVHRNKASIVFRFVGRGRIGELKVDPENVRMDFHPFYERFHESFFRLEIFPDFNEVLFVERRKTFDVFSRGRFFTFGFYQGGKFFLRFRQSANSPLDSLDDVVAGGFRLFGFGRDSHIVGFLDMSSFDFETHFDSLKFRREFREFVGNIRDSLEFLREFFRVVQERRHDSPYELFYFRSGNLGVRTGMFDSLGAFPSATAIVDGIFPRSISLVSPSAYPAYEHTREEVFPTVLFTGRIGLAFEEFLGIQKEFFVDDGRERL